MTWKGLRGEVESLFEEADDLFCDAKASQRFQIHENGAQGVLTRVDAIRPVCFVCPHCGGEHERDAARRPQGGGTRPRYCGPTCSRKARWARYYKAHGRTRRNTERDNQLARERYATRTE